MSQAIGDLGGEPDGEHVPTGVVPRESVGALLRARRLELGMSPGDVAAAVKITARRVVALEEERWDELPDGPFLRGFLRNVARVLQLDAAALLARVDASLIRTRAPETILAAPGVAHAMMPRRSGRLGDRRNSRSWILGAFVFALIAAGIAWSGTASFERTLSSGRTLLEATRGAAPAPVAKEAVVAQAPSVAVESQRIVTDAPAAPSPDAQSSPMAAAPVGGGSAAIAAANALTFHFNEDSWVEVKAADGKVLSQKLNSAGSDQEVDGTAPFSLIVGNAKGVELRFRGQPVDLGPHTRDQVARFTLP